MLTGRLEVDPARRYDIRETAALLGMSVRTLYKYTLMRAISPEVHLDSRKKWYTGKEIRRFYERKI